MGRPEGRGFWLAALLLAGWLLGPPAFAAGGDPLPRISCEGSLSALAATLYTTGLSGPDGLAFDPTGMLHVAQESAGAVSAISATGVVSDVLTGLSSPEGIAFAPDGALYVVEDVQNGRLLRRDAQGTVSPLATGLDAPEGVVWHPDGHVYLTESTAQFSGGNPLNLRSHVTRVSDAGAVTRILTRTLTVSLAGLTVAGDGLLYATNEASGTSFITSSVFQVEPQSGANTVVVSDLSAPEGLRFGAGDAALYVVEEDTGGGAGRLLALDGSGAIAGTCTGFFNLEDVAVDGLGALYVSEDGSGSVIRLAAPGFTLYLPTIPLAAGQ